MEKNVEICILYDLYGKILTDKQSEFIDNYYNNDLSLAEIAENNKITRQAVRDNIKKAEKKLFEYEEKLSFMKKMVLLRKGNMQQVKAGKCLNTDTGRVGIINEYFVLRCLF